MRRRGFDSLTGCFGFGLIRAWESLVIRELGELESAGSNPAALTRSCVSNWIICRVGQRSATHQRRLLPVGCAALTHPTKENSSGCRKEAIRLPWAQENAGSNPAVPTVGESHDAQAQTHDPRPIATGVVV